MIRLENAKAASDKAITEFIVDEKEKLHPFDILAKICPEKLMNQSYTDHMRTQRVVFSVLR